MGTVTVVTLDSGSVLAAVAIVTGLLTGGIFLGKLWERSGSFRDLARTIKEELTSIRETLQRNRDIAPLDNPSSEKRGSISESPRVLTKFGIEVVNAVNAKPWAKGVASIAKSSGERFEEDFEIEKFARHYVESSKTTELERMIGKATYEFGMDTVSVRDILIIELRDAILSLYGRQVPKSSE